MQRLGREFDGAVAISTGPLLAIIAAATETGAGVVLLGLGTVAANERVGRALRDAAGSGPPPLILVLCSAGELAAANRLASDGVFDHYLPHPDEFDPGRLAISVRLVPAPRGRRRRPRPAPLRRRKRRRAHGRSLLMVEDDEFTHQLVAVTLASHDVELVFESDGASAMDRIRAVRPDLVLMDVMLPGRDGVELTQGLKSDPELGVDPGRDGHRRSTARDPGAQHGSRRRRLHRQAVHARRAGLEAEPVPADAALSGRPGRRSQADVTGIPLNCPATAGPAGRG